MTPLDALTYWVMLNAKEEGYLYELPLDLEHVYPDADLAERTRLAHSRIAQLAAAGWVEVWASDGWPTGPAYAVPEPELSAVLPAPLTWQQPTSYTERWLSLRLTDAGLAAWRTTPWQDIPNLPSLFDH